jgi:hypothetical protein
MHFIFSIIWVQPCTVNIENIVSQFELPKDTQGNFKAKYRHCPAFISGSLKITTNFKCCITHYLTLHGKNVILQLHYNYTLPQAWLSPVW